MSLRRNAEHGQCVLGAAEAPNQQSSCETRQAQSVNRLKACSQSPAQSRAQEGVFLFRSDEQQETG